ncbi:MAG: hypothetical protein K1X50_03220 [Candidatus Promineofilum sp.]|nr:hypothetical protein [Promineifilum sp.]MCW5864667.1 hypothetical protein [Anaerolineae bacterium]
MDALFDSVFANLLTEFIVVVAGVLFANFVQRRIKQQRYGGWQVILYSGEPLPDEEITTEDTTKDSSHPLLQRQLSADTAQRILYDQTELDIYLKGRISPFANVNCDLVTELESGKSPVIARDVVNRRFVIYARSPKITLRSTDAEAPTR